MVLPRVVRQLVFDDEFDALGLHRRDQTARQDDSRPSPGSPQEWRYRSMDNANGRHTFNPHLPRRYGHSLLNPLRGWLSMSHESPD